MLKTLIIILILVVALAIGLHIDFSTTAIPSTTPTPKIQKKEAIIKTIERTLPKKEREMILASPKADNNLTKEILALFNQANLSFQKNHNEEAQSIYSIIIKKLQNHHEVKFLKYFAKASIQKAFLFRSYPTYDHESAIEILDVLIQKFENTEELELIDIYINVKIEQAYLQTKEETLEAYDQLLEKFKDKQDPYFIKKREELLLGKSFALMGENNDEAMEILDELIDKYQTSKEKNIPENIQFSILNNIELAIITNNDDSNYRELADRYMSDSPDKEPLLDMLEIIKNSQDLEQDDALAIWQEKHNNYRFPDWSFDELRKWAYHIEDEETKERVTKYINTFENHKYSTPSTYNSQKRPSTLSIPEEVSHEEQEILQ